MKNLEQAEQLERVGTRIAQAILEFCNTATTFYADDLRNYVISTVGRTAPGSADRVLRDLRQKGEINYEVVSRKDSFYKITEKREQNELLQSYSAI